jgi:hypothetical protein
VRTAVVVALAAFHLGGMTAGDAATADSRRARDEQVPPGAPVVPGGATLLLPTLRAASGLATIEGVVRHERGPLRVKELTNTEDVATCGARVRLESIVEGRGGTLGNVVVEMRPKDAPEAAPGTQELLRVEIRHCMHAPHVLVVPLGASVEVLNPDGILHRLLASCVRNPGFEVDLPRYRRRAVVMKDELARPERIRITCEEHPFMIGWWVVTDAPHHVLTGADGRFRATGLRPGRWVVTAWHEEMGELEEEVDVPAQGTATLDLVYK